MFAITERLLLRPGWPEDAAPLARVMGSERIVRNLAQVPWPYGQADALSYLTGAFEKQGCEFMIAERSATAPEVVGGIGLHPDPETPDQWEIGYWIAEDHWGKGYATEAGRAVIETARHSLGLRQINAGYFADNPASGRVLRKLGFTPTGKTAMRHSRGRGTVAPMVLMSLDLDDQGDISDGPMDMLMPMAA